MLFYNADTTLTVSQPLLRGFGRNVSRRGLTSAELRREEADRQQSLAEQQVAVDVAAAYYRVVSQQTFVEVARQSLLRARRLRDASEAKLDAGLVSQLDVLRSQQLVSQAEMQFFDAQSAVEDARDQLTFLLGRPETAPFEVSAAGAAHGHRSDRCADRHQHRAREPARSQEPPRGQRRRRATRFAFRRISCCRRST